MSAALVTPRITVDEFLQRPERTDGCFEELIEGVVYVSPNVKVLHNYIQRNVLRQLQPLEDQDFIVLGEVACRLTNESLPDTDACVVRGERYDATPEGEYFREAPELVVEIRSPSNTGTQLRQKSWLYLEHGAEQVWIIQPESSNVVVLTPQGDDRIVDESGTLEFRDLTIRVADLLRRRPRKE